MRESLVALKLVLDNLGVPSAVSKLDERMLVQKAVYLAKAAGVDLGYSYGWYVYGPYSPPLTRDYFALDEALATEEPPSDVALQQDVARSLGGARALLNVPDGVDLQREKWAELVASLIFLEDESRLGLEEARKVIAKRKPHLSAYVDRAQSVVATFLATRSRTN